MDHSQNFQRVKRSRYRSGAVGKSPTIGNINDHYHFTNKSTKTQRPSSATINKTKTLQPSTSWFNNTINSYSSTTTHSTLNYHDNNESFPSSPTCSTSYGYIQSLPTSSTNHGWIYHPQYGMIVFTYNEALETVKNHKKTRKYSMSFSESLIIDDKKENNIHLELPSNNNKNPDYKRYSRSPSRSYHRKYANSRSTSPNISHYTPSPSPSPSPGPPGICSINHESKGLLDINHLYVYQPVQFELANNQYIASPVCNINENHIEIEENLCNIDDDQHELENINYRRNRSLFQRNMARKYKKVSKIQNKSRSKSRGKRVFNDSDEAEPENDENNDKNTSFPFSSYSSTSTLTSTLTSTVSNDNLSHRKRSRKSQHSKHTKSNSKYSNLRRQLNAANAIKKQSLHRIIPSAPPKRSKAPKIPKTPTTTPTLKPTMNRHQAPPPPPHKPLNKSLGPRPTKPPPLPPTKKKQKDDNIQRVSARKLPFIGCTETECNDNPIGSVISNSSLRPSLIKINHTYSDSLSSIKSIDSAYSHNSNKSDKSCISDINVDINDNDINQDILEKKSPKKHHQKKNEKKNQKKIHKKTHKKDENNNKRKGFELNMSLKNLNIPDDDIGDNSPVPLQNQLSPRSLALAPSISLFGPSPRCGGRNRTNQKIALNVKVMNTVQTDDMSLYVFSPKGKHYEKMEVDPIIDTKQNNKDKDNEITMSLHKMGIIKDGVESGTKKRKKKKKNKKHKKKEEEEEDNEPLPPYVNYQRQRSVAHGNNDDDEEEEKKEKKERKEKKEKKESKQPQRTKSYKNVLKMPKFRKLRRKSNSDTLHSWVHRHQKKKLVPFCPSSCQYYVRDACLLQWEGKNIEKIKQNKKSLFLGEDKKYKNDTNKVENMENIYFSMTDDVELLCDELEEKINRLFNNNGGTIYVGVTDNTKNDDDDDGNNDYNLDIDGRHRHNKSNSFTFTKRNILHHKDDKGSPRTSLQNHIICGIKLNSKMRYKLKNTIISEIIGGFSPNIPHLINNFDLKFIPVVSQTGTIISRYFVIKITVVAPILGLNGEKIQFSTKDGYAHVIDF